MKYINAEKSTMLKKLREHLANTPREQLDAEFEALKDLAIDKPTEDKDVQMCNALWNLLKILYAQDSTITEVGIRAGEFRDWLDSIRDRFESPKEQKPVEWSERDESILNNIIAYKYLNIDDLKWIKELPKRFNLPPKQEWSEEDEQCIDEAIEILTNLGYDGEADNLKNLRPQHHWKPSEKQMAALLTAVGDEKQTGSDVAGELKALYYELKKL